MMHKAWSGLEEEPYCFSRSSIKFHVHTGQKWTILIQIDLFRALTQIWIHIWLQNDAESLKWQRIAALFFKVIHRIARSHGQIIDDFDQIESFRIRSQFEYTNDYEIIYIYFLAA